MKRILTLFLLAVGLFITGCANPGGGASNASGSESGSEITNPQENPNENPGNQDPQENPNENPNENPGNQEPQENPNQGNENPQDPPIVTGLDLFNSILANPSADYEVYMLEVNNLTNNFVDAVCSNSLTTYTDNSVGILLTADRGTGATLLFKVTSSGAVCAVGPNPRTGRVPELGPLQGLGSAADTLWPQNIGVEFSPYAENLRVRLYDTRNSHTIISVRVRMPN